MKNERLFRILGLIDEELIEEAAAPARPGGFWRWLFGGKKK